MNLSKNNFISTVSLINSAEKFVIATHVRPDADTIGSALALARGLRSLGKQVVVLSVDGVPETCAYLPDTETVVTNTSDRDFDVAIVCDAGSIDRVGSAAEVLLSAKSLLIIDHHADEYPTEGETDPVRLVDVTAAATAEIVFELLHQLRRIIFDSEIARQLMAGLVGDTGGFRFANVTPNTLEIASRLAGFGAMPGEAAREIYENRSLVNARLLGLVLLGANIEDDGKIVWAHITQEDFKRLSATDADTDSIVNQLRGIKGTLVGILFREVEPNRVQVSLRSRDGINVNRVASAFGGGGHVSASGCTISSSLEDAEKAVLAEVRACMAS
jgi:phosphoesterase RecJ-like protein